MIDTRRDAARIGALMTCLLATMTFGAACGDDSAVAGCIAGRELECPCPSGSPGSQVCGPDGTFSPCMCGGGADGGLDAGERDAAPSRDAGGGDEDAAAADAGPTRCDLFAQDCPPGQKCTSYANDGGPAWNDTLCVAVAETPVAVGDPCVVTGGSTSGMDDCAAGAICWNPDPATSRGTCVALCTGMATDPTCAVGTGCAMANGGSLAVCLADCDPVLPDCLDTEGCYPTAAGAFACAPAGMGSTGGAASYANDCAPGLVAVDGSIVGCSAAACCSPFCDTTDLDSCPPGLACEAWYEPGTSPPGDEDVGACVETAMGTPIFDLRAR